MNPTDQPVVDPNATPVVDPNAGQPVVETPAMPEETPAMPEMPAAEPAPQPETGDQNPTGGAPTV